MNYDFAVFGGGIFGSYAALFLRKKGFRVCLVEKEARIFRRASVVNQARLHLGYHYPRSVATARAANDFHERFINEHASCVNGSFQQIYAIDKLNSLIDAPSFERFCAHIGIPAVRLRSHEALSFQRIEAAYRVKESSFDPYLLARKYEGDLRSTGVDMLMCCQLGRVEMDTERYRIWLHGPAGAVELHTNAVINATYAATNSVNRFFGISELDLTYELSEVALFFSQHLRDIGLTVMDGPFCSAMPYGLSGLSSLTSVTYTHHEVSNEPEPRFSCQALASNCSPNGIDVCSACRVRPRSNYRKMLAQLRQYISEAVDIRYFDSMFTVKAKLRASYVDDARPTVVRRLRERPGYYGLFAGKVNSIYEIENALANV